MTHQLLRRLPTPLMSMPSLPLATQQAEKSLASWMAGNRLSNADVTRQKVKSNLSNLYSDYLSNANTAGSRGKGEG